MTDCVLGVDAGGTKTLAVLASIDGTVLGIGRSACSNFQSCGEQEASKQLKLAVDEAINSGPSNKNILGACYGVSGADREKDFHTVQEMLESINPCSEFKLVNDTMVALRAGTDDGVGIALIAGTGANAIGRNAEGKTLQIGGMGALTGDYGSAGQLAEAAVVAAFKGRDGRGEPTILSEKFCKHLEIGNLEDIIEYEFFDLPRGKLDMGTLAPLVFEAASQGDSVASEVLRQSGREIGLAAVVIMDKLFNNDKELTVVFGGSVFMKGSSPVMRDTVKRYIRDKHDHVKFVRLTDEPVMGALAFALDEHDEQAWSQTAKVWSKLRRSLKDYHQGTEE